MSRSLRRMTSGNTDNNRDKIYSRIFDIMVFKNISVRYGCGGFLSAQEGNLFRRVGHVKLEFGFFDMILIVGWTI